MSGALGGAGGKGNTVQEMNGNMDNPRVGEGIAWQARHSEMNDAPVTTRIVRGLHALMADDSLTGRAIAGWQGLPREDAMPLRLAGGFHHLHLTGDDNRLAPIYDGTTVDQDRIDAILLAVVRDHDARLLSWLGGPPQTNEAGRSAGIMAGLLWLSARTQPRFELLEIGSSGGANTMMDRFAFDLGGISAGPSRSPVLVKPEWRGPPPPAAPVEIVSIRGCDTAPIDLTDRDQALRLKSYTWPENTDRLERLDRIVAMAKERRPDVTRADASGWVEAQLARPQSAGVCRVLFHSIVWQYIPADGRQRIEAAMAQAGSRATPDHPLGWVQLETNRETFRHELRVRFWPHGEEWVLLGSAHAHGAWMEWLGE
jgi:hypothetical protein